MTPRELWVEALRSGEYEQGVDYLNRQGQLCCLGVACEVYMEYNNDLYKELSPFGYVRYDHDITTLPHKVQEWLRITNSDGAYGVNRTLIDDNDNHGMTFAEIADIIEENVEEMFRGDV